MPGEPRTAWLANIRLHPIKGLDPVSVPEARIGPNGGLELDRVWALFAVDGQWINGKRSAAIHFIRAEYDPQVTMVTLSVSSGAKSKMNLRPARFAFPSDQERAAAWFSEYFAQAVIVRHIPEGAPDDGLATGPTIVSTASLQTVCNLFPGIDLQEARERFRTTLEIDGVPAFWEDQLFSEEENYPVRFKIGEVAFEGSNPCARCPVSAAQSPHRSGSCRLPEEVQRNAPGFPAAVFARSSFRSFLSPGHQHPRALLRTRQTPPRRRRPGVVARSIRSRRTAFALASSWSIASRKRHCSKPRCATAERRCCPTACDNFWSEFVGGRSNHHGRN